MTISRARLLRMCATSRPHEVSMFCSHVAFALAKAHGTSPGWRKTSRLKEWIDRFKITLASSLACPGRPEGDHERVSFETQRCTATYLGATRKNGCTIRTRRRGASAHSTPCNTNLAPAIAFGWRACQSGVVTGPRRQLFADAGDHVRSKD